MVVTMTMTMTMVPLCYDDCHNDHDYKENIINLVTHMLAVNSRCASFAQRLKEKINAQLRQRGTIAANK